MAGKSPRKRSSGKARSGQRRGSRGGGSSLARSLGLVALGAAMALGATAWFGGSPALDRMMPRLTAMMEKITPDAERKPAAKTRQGTKDTTQQRKPERSRLPARTAPDRSIETAAVPAPRPPRPLTGAKGADGPKNAALRPPAGLAAQPKANLPDNRLDGPEPRARIPAAPGAKAVTLTGLAFPICGEAPGKNCVIDADTFVLNGKAYRVADIEVPLAADPKCRREAMLADRAKQRLKALLNAGPLELRAAGPDEDVYGRKLRTIHRDGRSLGAVLVSEGLARPAGGGKGWCT